MSDTSSARPDESRRDPQALRVAIERWMGAGAKVDKVDVPESNGMSSETILVDVTWPLVFRIAPAADGVTIFESYDLAAQFNTMSDVARLTGVPVPRVLWLEEDPGPLGAPFFAMERVEGDVPPDVMPYNFGDSFLSTANQEQLDQVQSAAVGVLAELHAIDEPAFVFDYLDGALGDDSLRDHVTRSRRHYQWVISDGPPSPLLERGFEWLEANWPNEPSEPVLSWGDARIGNMMFRDFEPVAVLDWEMASIAPREIDVSWMIFMHMFFEDLAHVMELPGMPDLLRRDHVEAAYREMSGHEPRDMDWYLAYSAIQHGIIMSQVQRRAIRFGAAEMPDDVDDLIMHRRLLEKLLG